MSKDRLKINEIRKSLDEKKALFESLKTVVDKLKSNIEAADIAAVIARRTGIPVSKMMTAEKDRLIHMESFLSGKIIGQTKAIEAIANAIRKSRAGLKPPNRPVGSFLFLGPTGTGKTYLPKLLAEFLFDDKNAMVRLDMSEFMESHSVAKMIGAPPGYVGYEAGGLLTEAVRRKPFSIILFDEVEKAHPDVFNVLLQLLDDGRLTDGQGRTVDFSNTIVVLTSNFAAEHILEADREGRREGEDEDERERRRPERTLVRHEAVNGERDRAHGLVGPLPCAGHVCKFQSPEFVQHEPLGRLERRPQVGILHPLTLTASPTAEVRPSRTSPARVRRFSSSRAGVV